MPFIDVQENNNYNIINNISYRPDVLKSEFINDISLNVITEGTTADERQINQAIWNILLTMKTERLFNINFGTNIYRYLFQSAGSYTASQVENEARTSILAVEKRIIINPGMIHAEINQDEHYIELEIKYQIKSTSEFGSWKNRLYL